MTLEQAETYLANCIELEMFEKGAFDDFTIIEKIVFAEHTFERVKLGMFEVKEIGL